MTGATAIPATWGACRFCGVAVAEGEVRCGICGAERPLSAREIDTAPRSVRRRLAWTRRLRAIIVTVVILGLAYALISAVISGPPNPPDPLTTSTTYSLAPGGYAVLSGEITGGDFVVGNLTSVRPAGASVGLAVYNSTEWAVFLSAGSATPVYSLGAAPSAQIVYAAPYTDTFYFAFENPYPASSDLTVTVHVVTQYESNVGGDGFS